MSRATVMWKSGPMSNFQIAQLDEIPPQRCPCGFTRRAFAEFKGNVASLHLVDIQDDSQAHYHKRMTEIYLVLEGEGQMELDGKVFPLKPMNAGMGMLTIFSLPMARWRQPGRM